MLKKTINCNHAVALKFGTSALLQYYDKVLSFEGKNFDKYSAFVARFDSDWLKNSLDKVNEYKENLADFKKIRNKIISRCC